MDIVQRMTNAVGIPEPSVAVANQAEDVMQIVELLNQEGRDLSRRYDWQALTFEATFNTVATESQGTLATIIGTQSLRHILNDTIWDRTQQQPIYGPLSASQWEADKARVLTGPFPQYQIRGNCILMYPIPPAAHACWFQYVSRSWCTDSAGTTYRTNVASDTDEVLLDDELMLAGLEWRYLRKKGLSYAEEFASYEVQVASAMSRDATKPVLRMDDYCRPVMPGLFVPRGSWNLP